MLALCCAEGILQEASRVKQSISEVGAQDMNSHLGSVPAGHGDSIQRSSTGNPTPLSQCFRRSRGGVGAVWGHIPVDVC